MRGSRIRNRILIPVVLSGLLFVAGSAGYGDPVPQGTDYRTAIFYVA